MWWPRVFSLTWLIRCRTLTHIRNQRVYLSWKSRHGCRWCVCFAALSQYGYCLFRYDSVSFVFIVELKWLFKHLKLSKLTNFLHALRTHCTWQFNVGGLNGSALGYKVNFMIFKNNSILSLNFLISLQNIQVIYLSFALDTNFEYHLELFVLLSRSFPVICWQPKQLIFSHCEDNKSKGAVLSLGTWCSCNLIETSVISWLSELISPQIVHLLRSSLPVRLSTTTYYLFFFANQTFFRFFPFYSL